MRLLKISTNLYVPDTKIMAVMDFKGQTNIRYYREAKEKNKLLDGTGRKPIKSIVLLQNGYVATCPYLMDTVIKRAKGLDEGSIQAAEE